ncbi:hypothetical protein CRUP_012756 [Coryphaenoides rupestris]|nr:hypothetical protein CRUP_012756 [Coryphaenoides rupestris]
MHHHHHHHHHPGTCNVTHCRDPTRCTPYPAGHGCRCTNGYYGDQCDKDAQLKVMCGKDFITMLMVEDFFKYYDVPLESLRLPNKSCGAQREVIGGVPYYMKNDTHISYSLSLLSASQAVGNIVRDPVIRIEYTCVYPYTRSVSLAFPVYVEVSVSEPKDFFVLDVSRTAPQGKVLRDPEAYKARKCVNDETVTILRGNVSADASVMRFSFDMFRFVSEPHELYLHCSVQLCLLKMVVLPVAVIWTLGLFLLILLIVAKAGRQRAADTTPCPES